MRTKGAKDVTELSFNRVRMMQNDGHTVKEIETATGHHEETQRKIFHAKTWKEWTRLHNVRKLQRKTSVAAAAAKARAKATKITVTTAQADQVPDTTPRDAVVMVTPEDWQKVQDLLDAHIRACNGALNRMHRRLTGPSGIEGRVRDIEEHLGAKLLEEPEDNARLFSRKSLLPWRKK